MEAAQRSLDGIVDTVSGGWGHARLLQLPACTAAFPPILQRLAAPTRCRLRLAVALERQTAPCQPL